MRDIEKPFELLYGELNLQVVEHEVARKRVFHVNFQNGSKPLVITVAVGTNDKKFWTSIPEGRQKEATEIGKLIADHIRSKKEK
ncbi:hypothetical protein [Pedobacter sp. P26]|uniref:hypothetical protein n=1 Tax=Pedobacter sp. P26 TaxID=3423956 RepID=UPI003D67F491